MLCIYSQTVSSTTVKYTIVEPTFDAHPHIVTFVVDIVTMCCGVFISIVSKYTYQQYHMTPPSY